MNTNWLWTVAARRVGVGVAAWFAGTIVAWTASDSAVAFFKMLADVWGLSITVVVDQAKLESRMVLVGIIGFTAGHDWLKLKFPESKWL